MIHPSIYSFSAPYRGPKESKEVNKVFTSIIYDLLDVYNELLQLSSTSNNNLAFCINQEKEPKTEFPTAGLIGDTNYSYKSVIKISQSINAANMRIDQILENL